MNKLSQRQPAILRLLVWLLLISGFGWTPVLWATPHCTSTPSAALTLPLSTQAMTAPSATGPFGPTAQISVTFNCTGVGGPNAAHIFATQFATYSGGGGGLLFPTSVNGISLLVTITFNSAPVTPTGSPTEIDLGLIPVNNPNFDATFTGQFYRTAGTFTPGTINPVTLIGQFKYGPIGSSIPFPSAFQLLLGGGGTISGSCTVNAPANFTVVLPTISTTALAGPAGTIAGVTPFNLSYTCANAGTTLIPSMTSTMADATIVGLINPISGNAANVGLRVMNSGLTAGVDIQGANQAPVVSTNGAQLLPYYVEYYRTSAAAIGAGPVTGTATYTLNYQ